MLRLHRLTTEIISINWCVLEDRERVFYALFNPSIPTNSFELAFVEPLFPKGRDGSIFYAQTRKAEMRMIPYIKN